MANKKNRNKKTEQTDLFGNTIKEPAPARARYISPEMEMYREWVEDFTMEELHEIRKSLGFDFARGNKEALVSAFLVFFSFRGSEGVFTKWFEKLPKYLSLAIKELTFKGYVDVKVIEKAAGKPVVLKNDFYYYDYYRLNPDLRLGIFDLYANYDLKLLFMKPVFRKLFIPHLPAPSNFSVSPCTDQELKGWSAEDSLSESMPLLLKALDKFLKDRNNQEKILRRGLNKRDIKELRKSSAFPVFPLGAELGIDSIDLIARFLMIDRNQTLSSQKKNVHDLLKKLIKNFFIIPPTGRIISNYLYLDSSFEFSVLCRHLSRGPGARSSRSPLYPHPSARSVFFQIITSMAETGSWYKMDEVAESIRMQALAFTIASSDNNLSEIFLKGEELLLPDGKIRIDGWEKGFNPDMYLKHTLITNPLLRGYCYLMASLGLLEIREEEPKKLLKKNGKLSAVSPFGGLTYGRVTPFGAWCLDISKEKPKLREVSYEAIADSELPLVTYRGHSLECKVFLERVGDPIGEDRFRITEASFIRDCNSVGDLDSRVKDFYRLIVKDPAPHWGELFSRVKERALLFAEEELCTMIQLPNDRELRRLFTENKKLSSLVARAEGGRIIVTQQNYKKLRKALEAYGVLKL